MSPNAENDGTADQEARADLGESEAVGDTAASQPGYATPASLAAVMTRSIGIEGSEPVDYTS